MDGVAVWYVSPYVSPDISCHAALTLWSRCWGEDAAKVYALKECSLVVDMSLVFFQGGSGCWWEYGFWHSKELMCSVS
jgi:hypothetical protein